ncbi:MAG: DUF2085 domain-containing protein [Balneolaceae bacterium]|nr:DUF2085 domain-containing protein [Balneolaceae bacterium]
MKSTILTSNQQLYYFLLVATGLLFVFSMGPGLFGDSKTMISWQHKIFHLVCHQDAFRSYSINGATMAVCARCFGIYSALFCGLVLAPIVAHIRFVKRKRMVQLLVATIALNVVDVIANAAEIYTNTLHSRFILGVLFGLSVTALITDEFFKRIILTEDIYGTTNIA